MTKKIKNSTPTSVDWALMKKREKLPWLTYIAIVMLLIGLTWGKIWNSEHT